MRTGYRASIAVFLAGFGYWMAGFVAAVMMTGFAAPITLMASGVGVMIVGEAMLHRNAKRR